MGKNGNSDTLYFYRLQKHWMVTAVVKLKDTWSLEESYDKPRQRIKKQRHHFANENLYSQTYGFSSCHILM